MAELNSIRRIPSIEARRYSLWRLIRANFYDLRLLLRESWLVLAGFGILALAGTLYLHFNRQFGPASALYETLKLLTLQSGLELPDDALGKLLFFLIPLLGLALIFQSVLNFGRLLLDKGSRREAWQVALASTYRNHVIICGLGRVGLRVVTQLLESGYEVVVIERDWGSEFVERALNLKVPVVLGDAREAASLRAAGLPRACAIVAAINDDLLNIEIALTARGERPGIRVVVRVFNEELDRNLERSLGRNSAFSASAIAAPTYAAAAVSREIDFVLPTSQEPLGIAHVVVQPDSQLSGFVHTIEETHAIRVLHHQDPSGRALGRDHMRQLKTGDTITLLGSLAALEKLRMKNVRSSKLGVAQPLPRQHPTPQYNTVIVCGLGKVGYRVVQQLYQLKPRPRIVVIRLGDTRNEFPQRISQLAGVETIIGDARDAQVLREAGLDQAYSIAALTSDDLLNLQIGLAARRQRADVHVVLRVFSDALAEKLADLSGIETIYSTSGLAGPTMAAAAVLGNVPHAFCAGGQLFSTELVAIRAGDLFAGRSVEDIRDLLDALVIELRRNGTALPLPALDAAMAPGDDILLLATLSSLARLRQSLVHRAETGTHDAATSPAS